MNGKGLPPPEYRTTLNVGDAINADIIDVIDSSFPKAVEQTKLFAEQFRTANRFTTALKVWQFLRNYVKYKRDGNEAQLIRLPSRFIADKTGDCKSYSLTAAAVLANLGLPVAFRYASYTASPIPSHVYVVTRDEKGNEIIVDGVYRYFNSEQKPVHKFDKLMKVFTLSGIQATDDITGIGKRKRGGFFRKALSFKKKLALAPSRKAFRIIVSLNLFGLARKLKRLNDKRPGKLKDMWEKKFGGKFSELVKSIRKGYNRWAKKHKAVKMAGIGEVYDAQMSGINAAPAFAAAAALAVPIVTAAASLMKKEKVTEVEPGEPTLDQMQNGAADYKQQADQGELSGIGKRKKGKGRFARKVKKIALAKHRLAFRAAVGANAFGLAVKLYRISKKDPAELKRVWEKLGGNYSQLMKSVSKGIKRKSARKKITGISAEQKQNANAIAALIATILKALGSLFKKHGEPKAGEPAAPGESNFEKIMAVADTAAEKFLAPTENAETLIDEGQADTDSGTSDDPSTAGFSLKPGLLLALAAGGFLLVSTKK